MRVKKAKIWSGRVTEGITVHEIGNASYRLAQDNGRCHRISKGENWNLIFLKIEISGYAGQDDASLYRHTALPDKRNLQKMIVVISPVKEEDIPESTADDTEKGNNQSQIEHMLFPVMALFLQKEIGHDTAG